MTTRIRTHIPFWKEPNAPVTFKVGSKTYRGIVLEWSDSSRRDSDHDLCKVEIEETTTTKYKDWNNDWHTSTNTKKYVWPHPIQSYRLRRRRA